MNPFRQRLPDGPLDIVGDVHGELEALLKVLHRLGCDPERGTADRPVVFVGDLVDRGPNSPGVVELFIRLREAGIAWGVAGNHEINLMVKAKKSGGGWSYGDSTDGWQRRDGEHVPYGSVMASEEQVATYRSAFEAMPLILERDDLRVVHAAWLDTAVEALPTEGDAGAMMQQRGQEIWNELKESGIAAAYRSLYEEYKGFKVLNLRPPEVFAAAQKVALTSQNRNPVKVLTSGVEQPADQVRFLGEKWRFVKRHRWWDAYGPGPACVIGHYWRPRGRRNSDPIWDGIDRYGWFGRHRNVFCVDYCVGRRFRERVERPGQPFEGGLAALRWPERTLIFDDRDEAIPTTGYRS